MFISVRLGVLVKVLVAAAVVVAATVLLITTRVTSPEAASAPTDVPGAGGEAPGAVSAEYRVGKTGGVGLNVRSCAGVECRKIGWLAEDATVDVTCRQAGWMRFGYEGDTAFASARYLEPAGDPAPRCGS